MDSIAYTQVPDNGTYLANTHYGCSKEPMDSSLISLWMVLSTLQYNPVYVSPSYQPAVIQASKAAYAQAGGQSEQAKATAFVTQRATEMAHSVGITDLEVAFVLGGYRVYRTHQVSVNGPKWGNVRFSLTGTENSGSIGVTYGF